jgi:hydrogenase expression/formation protein HypC
MCLSLAGTISALDGEHASVAVDGRTRRVSLAVLLLEGRPVAVGDWVLIHTGFAVAVLDPDDGVELARLHREIVSPEEASP